MSGTPARRQQPPRGRVTAAEAQRRLAPVVDSIRDGFYALDPDWRFSRVNDAALAYFGKTRDEMLGRSLFEVFPAVRGSVFETEYRRAMETGEAVHFTAPSVVTGRTVEMHAYPRPGKMTVLFRDVTDLPEDRADVDRRFRDAVAGQHDWEFQCRIRRLDGVVRWIWARGRGQYGEDGQPVRMLGLVQDVTLEKEADLRLQASIAERKRAEEELEESCQRYQALVETNVDFIWQMDAGGRYTYCSPQMERLWGIKPEDMTFMQADATLARSRGGLGLGLALAKELGELHGGSIEARSPGFGQGSEFTVRLPLDLTGPPPEDRAGTAPGPTWRRVLVIEDSADAAESLRDVLQIQGHEVAVAHDGAQGLARARELRPDLVLCDIGLPEDLQRAAEAGFDRHIAKPPSPEMLESVVAGA